jgi:hypothetical protein
MRYLVQFLTSFLLVSAVMAGQSEADPQHSVHGPHHLSVLLADTHANGEGDNFTLGLDYEYRVNELLGVGTVVERAYGELDATTLLAVADIHFQNGLIVQVGPGLERKDHDNIFVTRLGVLYEFESENFTLSPQLHWDYHDGEVNTVVTGIALGFSF